MLCKSMIIKLMTNDWIANDSLLAKKKAAHDIQRLIKIIIFIPKFG